MGDHQSILRLATNLVEARIDVAPGDDHVYPDPDEIIDLLSLRRVYVSDSAILNYFRAPALEEMTLWARRKDGPDTLELLQSFLTRSGCVIRRLCLRGYPNAEKTAEILNSFLSIVELGIIIHKPHAGRKIRRLMSKLALPAVAPQLSRIFVGFEKQSYMDYTAYLQLLESRWKAQGCALRTTTLAIEWGVGPSPATLAGLNVLRQDGLDVVLVEDEAAFPVICDWMYALRSGWDHNSR